MTWARIDDGFWRNEKVAACSDASLGLHVRAISYCADQATDGVLSGIALKALRAKAGLVRELVKAGLWIDHHDRFEIHDYLKYNPSAEQIATKRHSKAMAGAKGAASRWHGTGNAPDPTRTHTQSNVVVLPDARPAIFALYESMGWTINAGVMPKLEAIEEDHPPDDVAAAFKLGAEARCRNLGYIEAILRHWKDHGRDCDCTRKRNGTSEHVQANRGKLAGGGVHPRAAAAKPWD